MGSLAQRCAKDTNLDLSCSGQVPAVEVTGPASTKDTMHAKMSRQKNGEQLTSENLASAAAEEDIAMAYAALLKDNEAFRTRLEREKMRVIEAEKAALAQALLDSTDDLERALAAADTSVVQSQELRDLAEGVRLSLAVLYKRIAEMGAERMSTTGKRFDPGFAEAVGIVRVTDLAKHGIIIQEVRPGYRVGDRLLRPAQVRVGHYG